MKYHFNKLKMEMFMVHEHSKYTRAIDKYWLFAERKDAWTFFCTMAQEYHKSMKCECGYVNSSHDNDSENCPLNWRANLNDDQEDQCLDMRDGNYLIYTKFYFDKQDKCLFSRRP
jgi:hypothetical protein